MALPLRCACESFRLARGDCSLLAIANSTLLVCGASTGEVLAQPSGRRLRWGTAAFVAPGNRGDRFLSARTLSSGPAVCRGNRRRPRADCFRGLDLLAGPPRSGNGAACGQDRTHGRRRNRAARNLCANSASAVRGVVPCDRGCVYSGGDSREVVYSWGVARADAGCDFAGGARTSSMLWRGLRRVLPSRSALHSVTREVG
jgi:hypothetical protein